MSTDTKEVAIIGMGNRGLGAFAKGVVGYPDKGIPAFREAAHLKAICELNPKRAEVAADELGEYRPDDMAICNSLEDLFGKGPFDVVIVATPDHTHRDIAVRCMEAGFDVLVEKPMATTAAHCREMAETAEKTGRDLRVAFNARYGPGSVLMKKLLKSGIIGDVLQVAYTEILDVGHGGDYFHRWHRNKSNSGGLLIHKATHQFDIINYFLDDEPVRVSAFGDTLYYKERPMSERGERCSDCEHTQTCPHFTDLKSLWGGIYQRMYLDAEHHDGYKRDLCVFDGGADIEDTATVSIDYRKGAKVSYSLVAYAPRELQEVMITGTKGRIVRNSHTNGIEVRTIDGEVHTVRSEARGIGGHGGSDVNILKSVLMGVEPAVDGRAGSRDGIMSVAIGDAANRSIAEGRTVSIDEVIAG